MRNRPPRLPSARPAVDSLRWFLIALLFAGAVAPAAASTKGSISGVVFEDVNYGGGTGRNEAEAREGAPLFPLGRPRARVELFADTGELLARTRTESDGDYRFERLGPGTYTVRVVNETVTSSRPGGGDGERAVQTFRADGLAEPADTGRHRIGGERPTDVDAPAASSGQTLHTLQAIPGAYTQSIVRVHVGAGDDVREIDFGFNFDTIVNTNPSGQGSLAQFLDNANRLSNNGLDQDDAPDGVAAFDKPRRIEHGLFMIPSSDPRYTGNSGQPLPDGGTGDAFLIPLESPLPPLKDEGTALDGGIQTALTGDTNPAVVDVTTGPEIILLGAQGSRNRALVKVWARASVRSIGLTGSQGAAMEASGLHVMGNVSAGTRIEDCTLVGNAANGLLLVEARGVRVTGCISRDNGSAAYPDGAGALLEGCHDIVLGSNVFRTNAGAGVEAGDRTEEYVLEQNVLKDNGRNSSGVSGARGSGAYLLRAGRGAVRENEIHANRRDGVTVDGDGRRNRISRNDIRDNGALGIDLLDGGAAGVTRNDPGDGDEGANELHNFAVLESAEITGAHLLVRGFSRPETVVELFEVAGDPTGFGEGDRYLVSLTEGGSGSGGTGSDDSVPDRDDTVDGYGPAPVNGLDQGEDRTNRFEFEIPLSAVPGVGDGSVLAATATRIDELAPVAGDRVAVGPTSELGGGVTVGPGGGDDGVIGVAKNMTATGNGPFAVTVDYHFENFGNVAVSTLSMADNLDQVFGAGNWSLTSGPALISGPATMTVNPAFTGDGTDDELLGGGSLDVAETAQVRLTLTVTNPGTYTNRTVLEGMTPGGTPVRDLSTAGTDPDPNGDGDPIEDAPTVLILAAVENGVIGVAKNMTATGNGPFAVTVDYHFENFGNVAVSSLSMPDDLDQVFGAGNWTLTSAPALISGPATMTVNPAFTGDGADNELLGGGSLDVADTAQVRITVSVTNPGTYTNQTVVSGLTPGGAPVSDTSTAGTDPDPNGDDDPAEMDPTVLVLSTVENGSIGVAKNMTATGNGPFAVTVDYHFENFGNVAVSSLSMPDDLDQVFGAGNWTLTSAPALISGPATMTVNPAFTGDGADNELLGGGSLDVADTAQVRITVSVTNPGTYTNQTVVSGLTPGGAPVSDTSTAGTDPDPNGDDDPAEMDPTVLVLSTVENGSIGVAKNMTATGNGPFAVTVDYHFENFGNVAVSSLSMPDDLDQVFGAGNWTLTSAPALISGPATMTVNPAFTGDGADNELLGGGSLDVAETAQVQIALTVVSPGTYTNQAVVSGLTPGGAPVSDTSTAGTDPDPNGDDDPAEMDPTLLVLSTVENGSIGVAKNMTATGNGPFAVTVDYHFENFGNVALDALSMLDDLDQVFGAGNWTLTSGPALISGPATMTVNSGYTGDGTDNELLGGGSLDVAETAQVQIALTVVSPGTYTNQAVVNGLTPSAAPVSDTSTSGTDPDPNGDDNPDEMDPTLLVLSPAENGVIGLAKNMTATGIGPFAVTIDYHFENFGNVALDALSMLDDLDQVFGAGNWTLTSGPALISGPATMTVNSGYTGDGTDNDLLGGGSLDVAETAQVQIALTVTNPGTYTNQAVVDGLTPGGAPVSDTSTAGTDPDPDGDDDPAEMDPTELLLVGENGVIGLAKDMTATGTGPFDVAIDYFFENFGNVPVNSLSMMDDLNAVFGTGNWTLTSGPALISGPATMTVNSGYTGDGVDDEILGGGSLGVAETAQVRIGLTVVSPGMYTNQALVNGFTPGGAPVSDLSTAGTDPDPNGDDDPAEDEPSELFLAGTENGVIGLAKSAELIAANPFQVRFSYVVQNYGEVALSGVSILSDLDAVFGTGNYRVVSAPSVVTDPSGTFVPNPAFDGRTDTNLLLAGALSTGVPNDRSVVELVVEILRADDYECFATAEGTTPNGTTVTDLSTDGTDPDPNGDGNPDESTPTLVSLGATFLTSKQAEPERVSPGDFVSYRIEVTNLALLTIAGATISDEPPAGFHYLRGSATLTRWGADRTLGTDDDVVTPILPDGTNPMNFVDLTFGPGESIWISYVLRVGADIRDGTYINRATPILMGSPAGNTGAGSVTIEGDPVFERTSVIGKVFHDVNHDGYPDPGEPGIPGARLATSSGLLIETDEYGRYHIADVDAGRSELGRNFILKVDPRSLPPRAEFTTENPRVLHLTSSVVNRINFGIDPGTPETALGLRASTEPAVIDVVPVKPRRSYIIDDITFPTAKATICPVGMERVREIAGDMSENPELTARIEGHADHRILTPRPEFKDNQELSEARAKAVRNVLQEKYEIESQRLSVEGFGDTRPRVLGNTSEALRKNRRVEVHVFGPEDLEFRTVPERVTHRIQLDPTGPVALPGATLVQELTGLSYVAGSARWRGAAAGAPEVREEGRTIVLSWPLETLESGTGGGLFSLELKPESVEEGTVLRVDSRVTWQTEGGPPATTGLRTIVRARNADEGDAGSGSDETRVRIANDRSVHPGFAPSVGGGVDAATGSAIPLAGGGVLWVTEDPTEPRPRLDILGPSEVRVERGRVAEPVRFAVYTNYSRFLDSWELLLFSEDDDSRTAPLASLTGSVHSVTDNPWEDGKWIVWDGTLGRGRRPRAGQELQYVLRVRDAGGSVDETHPRRLLLTSKTVRAPESAAHDQAIEGETNLRFQTIPVRGGVVRLHGNGLEPGGTVRLNERTVVADSDGRLAYETILPFGANRLEWNEGAATGPNRALNVEVGEDHFFLVGMANVTLGGNNVSGNRALLAGDPHHDGDLFDEGRLAFYLRSLHDGDLLITAHLDTHTEELENLFKNLDRKDPRSLFRRLDPDRFYLSYGDDSTVRSDVDTQGRFYGRVDWRRSTAVWGNYATGLNGTEYAQFNRSLYGGLLEYRSQEATPFGEPRVLAKGFASEAQSVFAHNEFLGTGGSLYYLKHDDVVQGSEKAWVEVRDRDTDRLQERVTLERYRDYEMDDLQGRLILSRPLMQVVDQVAPSIIKNQPLDGNRVILMVDYEYVPSGFAADELTGGGRGKAWIGDHVGVGATFIEEERTGQNHQIRGGDVTLRHGTGSFLKGEYAQSRSLQADTALYSEDGGLTFTSTTSAALAANPDFDGEALAVEGRLDGGELADNAAVPTIGLWWKRRSADFSTARLAAGVESEDYGGELQWRANAPVTFSARYSFSDHATVDEEEQITGQAVAELGVLTVGGEFRRVELRPDNAAQSEALLGGAHLGVDVVPGVNVYVSGQTTIDREGGYESNDLASVGVRARVSRHLSAHVEGTSGDRGNAALGNVDFQLDPTHRLYATYTLDADRTEGDRTVTTVGQRKALSHQVDLFTENQFSHSERRAGIGHVYGLQYRPWQDWVFGTTYQRSDLDDDTEGEIDRQAVSLSAGFRDNRSAVSLRGEYRTDEGQTDRTQWVTANRGDIRWTPSTTLLGKLNFSVTEDDDADVNDARFVETGGGIAYRPVRHDRFQFLGKYTFLYDLPPAVQNARPDQRSHVFSGEALYDLTKRWEIGSHFAHKRGELRLNRDAGGWFVSRKNLAAARARYHMVHNWDALAEYRWLWIEETEETKQGALAGLYRHIGPHVKLGVGYNFTDFSSDLTDLDYDNHGWFITLIGKH